MVDDDDQRVVETFVELIESFDADFTDIIIMQNPLSLKLHCAELNYSSIDLIINLKTTLIKGRSDMI